MLFQGHFDPKCRLRLSTAIGICPIGSLVKMRTGRLHVVILQNSAHFTRPSSLRRATRHCRVRAGDAIAEREPRDAWITLGNDVLWDGELASGEMLPGTVSNTAETWYDRNVESRQN